ERHRGKLELLPDGPLVAPLTNAAAATDLAARAARCALALRQQLGPGAVAVVARREVHGPGLPESELFGRAADLLASPAAQGAIRIDELTSVLLEHGFATGATGLELRGERGAADRA